MVWDKEREQDYHKQYYEENKKIKLQQVSERYYQIKESILLSLTTKKMHDIICWKLWFRKKANDSYKPCSVSPEAAFNLMIQGCFYCGDFATTLDRLDSTLEHSLENCVGCCEFCNRSKAACDPMSFILRAVYRRIFVYYEDDDIWNDNIRMPLFSTYEKNVQKKQLPFKLTQEKFKELCTSACWYCKRHPSVVGIDKIWPDNGYILDNCVPCCQSCNMDKLDASLEEFTIRDERITSRYLYGSFDEIPHVKKNASRFKNSIDKTECPVYQYALDGSFVREHISILDAEKLVTTIHIRDCLDETSSRKTAGNFMWFDSYRGEKIESIKKKDNAKRRVYQYTMDGTFVREYESVSEATRNTNIRQSNISSCALGQRHKSAGGFVWSYEKRA